MAAVAQTTPLSRLLWPTLAWIIALIFFFPIFWLVFTSFKTDADAVKPEHLFFFTPTLENYANMTENYDYWRFAINSVITATFATAFALAGWRAGGLCDGVRSKPPHQGYFGLDAVDQDAPRGCGSLSHDVFDQEYARSF